MEQGRKGAPRLATLEQAKSKSVDNLTIAPLESRKFELSLGLY